MTPEQIKEKRVVELRKLCDEDFHGFSDALFQKSVAELRMIARELGIDDAGANGAEASLIKQFLVYNITRIIRELGGYGEVEGRLEILSDNSGFLRDVHLRSTDKEPGPYDNYDVRVSTTLIQRFNLKHGDTVLGLRRWPYVGEDSLVMLKVDEVNHVSVSSGSDGIVQQVILAQGLVPLTQEAADAALDTIDFIAAAVRGYDAIEVTNIVRPIWRAHLAYWYPHLAPVTQQWFANAPQMQASIQAQWPLLDPGQRGAILQQWAIELPQMLLMIDPVLAEAQAMKMQETHRSQLADLRQRAQDGQPPALTDAQAINELNRRAQSAINLQNFSTKMTANTLNLMAAMSGHAGGWSTR